MKYASFKEFLTNTYELDELKDIAKFGCQGGVSGMIYYSETTDLYNFYCDDLHDILDQYKQETGEMPSYIVKNLNDGVQFRNAMVWFCAEYLAYELANSTEEA